MSLCWRPFVCIVFITILNILSVTLLWGFPVLTSLCLYCICYNTEHFVFYIVTSRPCVDVPLSVLYLLLNILSVTLLRGVPVLTSLCLYCICCWTFCLLHCYESSLCWRPFVCIVFVAEHFVFYIVTRCPCVDVPLSVLYLLLNILSVTLLRVVPVLMSLCLYCICYNTEHFVCYIVTRCPCVDAPSVCIVFVTILNILSVTLLRGVPVLTSLCLYCICYNTEHFVCYIVTSRPCVDAPLSVLYLLQYWTFCLLHCYESSLCWRPFVCIVFVAEHFVSYIVTRCPCVDVPLSVLYLLLNILSFTLLRVVPVLTSLCLYCICCWTFCLLHCYEVSLCWCPFVCIVFVAEHFVSYIVTSRPCVDVPLSVLYLLQYWTFCLLHCYEVSLCWRPFCLYCICYNIEHFVCYIVTRCPCVDVPLSVLYLLQHWTFCLLHCYESSLCWRPFVCIVFVTILNILSVTLLRGVPVLTPLLSVLYLLQYWTFCLLHCYEVSLCWRPFVCIVFVTILNILSVTLLRGVPVLTPLLSVLYLLQYWTFCLLHCDDASMCWCPFVCIVFVTEYFYITLLRVVPVLTYCICYNNEHFVYYINCYDLLLRDVPTFASFVCIVCYQQFVFLTLFGGPFFDILNQFLRCICSVLSCKRWHWSVSIALDTLITLLSYCTFKSCLDFLVAFRLRFSAHIFCWKLTEQCILCTLYMVSLWALSIIIYVLHCLIKMYKHDKTLVGCISWTWDLNDIKMS